MNLHRKCVYVRYTVSSFSCFLKSHCEGWHKIDDVKTGKSFRTCTSTKQETIQNKNALPQREAVVEAMRTTLIEDLSASNRSKTTDTVKL